MRVRAAGRWTARVLVVLVIAALVPVVRAMPAAADAPTNDSFASAQVLTGPLPIRVLGTVEEATKEPGEPNHAGQPGGRSVWYRWTADVSGFVSIDTCAGTFDSLLGVYTGDAVDALTPVVSSDNGCTTRSRVTFDAVAGTVYQIAVDNLYEGPDTAFELAIDATTAPANDAFAHAEVLSGPLPLHASATNVYATKEAGEPDHAGQPGGHSIWYSWTADAPGQVVINTCTSNFNTLLAVYTGDAVDALAVVAANDNTVGCEQNGGPSQVQFSATAGQTYRIAVDGRFERTGNVALTIRLANPPPNDHFADAQVIDGPLPITVNGTNVEATKEPGEPDHQGTPGGQSVWYTWTPESTAFVWLDTCHSNFTPVMAVYTGDAVDALTTAAIGRRTANCGPGPQGGAATLVFEAVAGQAYRIAIDGAVARLITLRIFPADPPANDDFADAETITGALPLERDGVTIDATKEPGEPNHAGNAGGASIWFSWTPDETGRVSIDTCGSTYDTVLAVYTGDAVDALTPIASNRFSPTCDDSTVFIEATAGTTYRIAVDGFNADSGHVALAIKGVTAPANDAFADAQELTGSFPITTSGSNANGSKEAGEPNHAGNVGGASIWFRWTPTESGLVVVETCESDYDTLLAVYTGDAVGALTPVASNDNAAATDCGFGFRSRLRLNAVAGSTYRIAVDGRNGENGSVELTIRDLDPPANDDFADAQVIPAALPIAVRATNLDATKEPGEPSHAGNPGGASIWYRWTPDVTAPVVVDTCGGDASLLGVYSGSAVDGLTLVKSSTGCGGIDGARFTAVAGTTYSIAVDGFGGRTGSAFLGIRPLPLHDHFADAHVLEGALPIAATGSSRDATTEAFEPDHAGLFTRTSVWYRWTAPSADPVVVDLCASGFDTAVGIYTGSVLKSLTVVVSNDDACGVQSRVTLTPVAGETYHIAVSGDRWGGDVALTLREPNPPANDDFANAQELRGVLPITVRGTTADATAEPGEPSHAGFTPISSVWFRWTPTFSGPVTVTLCASRFDSLLGVYTGDRVDALSPVVSDDDGCGAGGPSRAHFEAVAGETYSFAVDGWHGASGFIELAVRLPPPNDDLAGAQVLAATGPVTARGTTVDATAEPGEHRHAGYRAHASVWYSWTPAASGPVTIDTCGSGLDTALAVYTGDAVDALTEVASNDDADLECGWRQSEVVIDAVAGTTYLIAIETGVGAGTVGLQITPVAADSADPPANDDFGAAEDLRTDLPAESAGSNIGASAEPGEPDHAGIPGGGSVWFRWTADHSGPVIVETCGSSFDTTLAVYTGSAVDSLTTVAENDDACSVQSRVSFTAVAGTAYHLAVDGFFGSRGAIELRIREKLTPPNDAFGDAITLAGSLPVEATGSNLDATRQPGEPANGGASVWYSWAPTVSETVVIDACRAGWLPPRLAVYTGDAVEALTTTPGTGTTPSECDGAGHARFVLPAAAGTTYRIVIDGVAETADPFTLTIRRAEPPANDRFADAEELTSGRRGLPISVRGTNVDAALESGEPYTSAFYGGASIWYRWTALTSGPTTIETCGSEVDTNLDVYTGTSLNRLQSVRSNEDSCGPQSRVTVEAVAGETYRIAVDGSSGDTGDIRLTIRAAEPPANDDFADAQALSGELPIRVSGTTVDATRESSEMPHGFGYGAASVWYRFTPTTPGRVVVDVCDNDFGPQLAVYRGEVLYPTEEVVFADTGVCTVAFFAAAGETYRIAVDGEDGAAGDFELEIRAAPPNDDIGDATVLAGSLPITVTGDNREATLQPGEPDHADGTGGASVWHQWSPTTSRRVVIDTCGSGIQTLLGVYTGVAVNRLTEVASDAGSCGGRSRLELDAVAGETYWIAVDGADGASGRIRLSIASARGRRG